MPPKKRLIPLPSQATLLGWAKKSKFSAPEPESDHMVDSESSPTVSCSSSADDRQSSDDTKLDSAVYRQQSSDKLKLDSAVDRKQSSDNTKSDSIVRKRFQEHWLKIHPWLRYDLVMTPIVTINTIMTITGKEISVA